jgi:hypothetical protein
VDAAAVQLNEEEHLQPLQPDSFNGDEVHGKHTLTVCADQVSLRQSASRADRSNASLAQPSPDRHGRDTNAETSQLTNDALYPHRGFSAA